MLRRRSNQTILPLSPCAKSTRRRSSSIQSTPRPSVLDYSQPVQSAAAPPSPKNSPLSQLTITRGASPTAKASMSFASFRSKTNQGNNVRNVFVVAALVLFVITVAIRDSHNSTTAKLQEIQRKLSTIKRERDEYESNFQRARKMANEISDAARSMQEKISGLESDNGFMMQQINRLKQRIQAESKREVIERFGPGPFKVEFTLELSPPHNTFTLELAPLDMMPHSIHVFLEAIRHKIWDGKSFWLNAYHLVQAGSNKPYDPSKAGQEDWSHFLNETEIKNSLTVSFPEYHEEYPHEAYTIGFAGSPGGPDFYISKRDNSESHGPNKQKHHRLPGDADPCFGVVAAGIETLKLMDTMELIPGTRELRHPVGIATAVLLS